MKRWTKGKAASRETSEPQTKMKNCEQDMRLKRLVQGMWRVKATGTNSTQTGCQHFLANLLYQFVALFQFQGSVLDGGAGSVMDLLPVLIGRLADVCHGKAKSAQPWTIKNRITTSRSNAIQTGLCWIIFDWLSVDFFLLLLCTHLLSMSPDTVTNYQMEIFKAWLLNLCTKCFILCLLLLDLCAKFVAFVLLCSN